MNHKMFNAFQKLTHELTGVSISDHRQSMLEARVGRRMRALAIEDTNQYFQLVQACPDEQMLFVDNVTTHETSFFRTPRIWQYLEREFLPKWYLANPSSVFKVWSAATSSGEEAYSLAIILNEFKKKHEDFNYRITATDVSTEMIQKCLQGSYQKRAVSSLLAQRPSLAKQYLTPHPVGYQVNDTLTNQIQFQIHNLFSDPNRVSEFDLVLLRNVLIYFTQDDQDIVLSNVHNSLKHNGTLIVGESESILHSIANYENVAPCIYQATAPLH